MTTSTSPRSSTRSRWTPCWEKASTFGLDPWLDVPFQQLSTGVTRRAWLVVCLARGARVALVDEPFLGLDASGTEEVVRLLSALARTQLVVVIAHDWPDDMAYDRGLSLVPAGPLHG